MNEETSEPSWLNINNVNDEDSTINTPSKLKIQESHDNNSLPSWVLEEGIENNKLKNTEKDKLIQKSKDKTIKIIYNKKNNINDENNHQDDEDCKCYPSDSLLFTFQCYHFTCGLSGLLAFLSHIYSYTKLNTNIYHILMHTYIAILCLLVLFIELDWRLIITKLKIMDIWIFRGFFYIFIGLLTVGIENDSLSFVMNNQIICGIILCSYGICYIIMGLLCMKSLKIKRLEHQRSLAINED